MQQLIAIHQFFWMLESHCEQRLAWEDARHARIARAWAEHQSELQLQAMLEANPSGSLGHATLNDVDKLREAGLL